MKLTDGKKTVSITMREWAGSQYTPDMSGEFFGAGGLPLVFVEAISSEAHKVNDVDYCIEQAEDWATYRGDYCDPEVEEYNRERGVELHVDVEVLHEA